MRKQFTNCNIELSLIQEFNVINLTTNEVVNFLSDNSKLMKGLSIQYSKDMEIFSLENVILSNDYEVLQENSFNIKIGVKNDYLNEFLNHITLTSKYRIELTYNGESYYVDGTFTDFNREFLHNQRIHILDLQFLKETLFTRVVERRQDVASLSIYGVSVYGKNIYSTYDMADFDTSFVNDGQNKSYVKINGVIANVDKKYTINGSSVAWYIRINDMYIYPNDYSEYTLNDTFEYNNQPLNRYVKRNGLYSGLKSIDISSDIFLSLPQGTNHIEIKGMNNIETYSYSNFKMI